MSSTVCTTDDDCFRTGFCGSAVPSYGSNYFESDAVDIPGEVTAFISQAEEFDGWRIIRRPATDHPDLDMDFTIITYVQQSNSNTGYVIAKGFNDQMRDWGLLLAYNRIEIIYRTTTGSYETITFDGVTVADGNNHSVVAVIDSKNKLATIVVDGVASTMDLIVQCQFQPGVSCYHVFYDTDKLHNPVVCSSTFYTLVEDLKHTKQITISLKEPYTIYLCTTLHYLLMISRSQLLNFKLVS